MTNCGRCHKCGTKLQPVLDRDQYCHTCIQYRRYCSHGYGWSNSDRDIEICPETYGGGLLVHMQLEQIDACFENVLHQYFVMVNLYRLIYPNFDEIDEIVGYPKCSESLSDYIFNKFIRFDQEHHPKVFSGGAWMNKGWARDEELEGYTVVTAAWKPIQEEVLA